MKCYHRVVRIIAHRVRRQALDFRTLIRLDARALQIRGVHFAFDALHGIFVQLQYEVMLAGLQTRLLIHGLYRWHWNHRR